ncbi:chymotrypsin-2-like [Ptiloglossa arizonensis]|uniref:chymotrypsin-2-like n=1 Tax=Ptiloglossa arizonensis TaxID=3350558 RepID=UPI003F9F51CB
MDLLKLDKFSVSSIMIALAVLLILGSVIAVNGVLDTRIVGGHNASEGKYPYQVFIRQLNFFICGGSIIHSRYILTAAHCIHGANPEEFTVVVGTNYLKKFGVSYSVKSLFTHTGYDENLIIHDIGLILLNESIQFNERVRPIRLAPVNDISPNETAVVTGWGRLYYNGTVSNELQELNLTVISLEQCKLYFQTVTERQVCTLTKSSEGVCNGDSGGPLVVNGFQIGIVSYGFPCAFGVPDVYTRVYSYIDWINNNIKSSCVSLSVNIALLLVMLTLLSQLRVPL